ncbi:MAG: cobyric acid synthase [Desulfuromonadaceae bacterium]|nr:cobyric acid synthase [Desulfuromonadaceae bacterium]MDD2847513.1 cobyric acid synthase [Desulfuromonadaceae bacterium]MDD4131374.1 cobyric acid synthase [Desulfuromonadaceae bacterium]
MAPLYIVGTGPGATSHLTDAAKQAIAASEVIVGYDNYVELVRPLLAGKEVVSTGMMKEVERCREAIRLARAGRSVSLVSGGDSGIYGMAGLVLELVEADAKETPGLPRLDVQIVPGISAVQAAAALIGAPLMHDFAVISLSDLLTPWELIKVRLEAAARADFVISIYNPRSKSRRTQIQEAQTIILAHRPPETPVGIVRNACRDGQTVIVTTLGHMFDHEIDMTSIVLIGNASSFIDAEGRIVTPRGYAAKYGSGVAVTETVANQEPLLKPAAVMFCGTASDVGKSIVTSAFCRCLVRRGLAVAPFKSQNMSLNSYVTPEGGEIGRAQAVQAQACEINPHTDMNPVLLKPNSDTGSQIVVQGRPVGNMSIAEYDAYKPTAFAKIQESYDRLRQSYEFIVIEGAGSISEINLKDKDIANLKIAAMAKCPVILVADIDRGGVFAQIVGTIDLLEPLERSSVKGIIINKFRGDVDILKPGIDFIEQRTGIPVLGVLPWFADISLPAEDSVVLGQRSKVVSIMAGIKKIHIGVLKLPRISNFTDFEPLQSEGDVQLSYVEMPEQLQGLDVLIMPGSKSTIADLYFLMERGLFGDIRNFKGHIIGVCGGFQMLGTAVLDPAGVESSIKEAEGLDLLPSTTILLSEKETHQALAYLDEAGLAIAPECNGVMTGYEIHMGQTTLGKGVRPFSRIFKRGDTPVSVEDGAVSPDGRIFGTYLHGLFENSRFREIYLNSIRLEKGMPLRRGAQIQPQHDPYEQLAEQFEKYLDLPRILTICGLGSDTR